MSSLSMQRLLDRIVSSYLTVQKLMKMLHGELVVEREEKLLVKVTERELARREAAVAREHKAREHKMMMLKV